MPRRYADDIKRIVGIDPNQSRLGPPLAKPSLLSRRGIGYGTADGGTGRSSGAGGETEPPEVALADSDTGENRQETDSGIIPNTDDNSISMADLIDGIPFESKLVDPILGGLGLDYDDQNALLSLTGVDCSTGDEVVVQLREGLDFIPPDEVIDQNGNIIRNEWENAETPPAEVGWTSGLKWQVAGRPYYSTPQKSADAYAQESWDAGYTVTNEFWFSGTPSTGGVYQVDFLVGETPGSGQAIVSQTSCTPTAGDDVCPLVEPTVEQWPSDGKYRFRFEGGQFITSQYDGEVPDNYRDPVSSVEFCTEDGRTVKGTPTNENGSMWYETSGGAPTGVIRVFDNAGHMTGATDTTGFVNYLPTEPAA